MQAMVRFAPIGCGNCAQKFCYTVRCLIMEGCAVLNTKFFDEISTRLSEVMASSPAKDFEKNARALLTSAFAKLDLVTREEFDVQAQLLLRTREKLAALEMRVTEVEAQRK